MGKEKPDYDNDWSLRGDLLSDEDKFKDQGSNKGCLFFIVYPFVFFIYYFFCKN